MTFTVFHIWQAGPGENCVQQKYLLQCTGVHCMLKLSDSMIGGKTPPFWQKQHGRCNLFFLPAARGVNSGLV